MKNYLISLALPALLAFSPNVFAGEQPSQVVELFTSQGCSSCPPSNALVNDWARRDDVLALTYSVEYWDYLGWKDTFADPKFTARQRAYANAIGHGRVYTPQMVINGARDKFRFSRAQIKNVTLADGILPITFGDEEIIVPGNNDIKTPCTVRLVRFIPGQQTVDVKRGENGGKALTLTNVVTDVQVLGNWPGEESRFALPARSDNEAFAVLVQQDDDGPIISAAVLD